MCACRSAIIVCARVKITEFFRHVEEKIHPRHSYSYCPVMAEIPRVSVDLSRPRRHGGVSYASTPARIQRPTRSAPLPPRSRSAGSEDDGDTPMPPPSDAVAVPPSPPSPTAARRSTRDGLVPRPPAQPPPSAVDGGGARAEENREQVHDRPPAEICAICNSELLPHRIPVRTALCAHVL